MMNPYAAEAAERSARHVALYGGAPERREPRMPKIMKKFEHKEPERGAGRKYDWNLILGGQNVLLEAGEDYDALGTNKKTGESFDRTDDFAASIKTRAADDGKVAHVTKVGRDGKPLDDQAGEAAGIVVTAVPMTAEQLAARDARRAASKEARKRSEANGHQAPAATEAAAAVAPE